MAETVNTYDFLSELQNIITLLWGSEIKEEVFRRWSQAFMFLPHEPTALVQLEGGPCAVIAPVQAFILKTLLLERPEVGDWRGPAPGGTRSSRPEELLVAALCEILTQASPDGTYKIVYICGSDDESDSDEDVPRAQPYYPGYKIPSSDYRTFHSRLRAMSLDNVDDVQEFYEERLEFLRHKFAVLVVLYSVIATRGLAVINEEVGDIGEPLIESVYGYGSQSLINLMLTGRAVSHVWDNDKDVDGLQLKGIDRQGEVGYLALLETMRLCEVGSYLKNPRNPVWVLASETHLTVLFSPDNRLVSPETASEVARRVFRSFDPDGNNFIAATHLQEVLQRLDLVADPEYVQIMARKLDAENLGIILLHAFLEEFFPEQKSSHPDTFILFHYNGLRNSHHNGSVRYDEGTAVLLESEVHSILPSNPMLTCLQTKWPTIEVTWVQGRTPSLN